MTERKPATRILVVLALINLGSYASRNALIALNDTLKLHYSIDDAGIGFLQTMFMLPHAAATLPFGWAGDVYDRRRVIAFGITIAGIGCILGSIGSRYEVLLASRVAIGFGTAAVVPVANSIISQLYDGPKKAARMSVLNLGLFLGGMVGAGSGIALGFPTGVIALGVLLLVLAVVLIPQPVPMHAETPTTSWWRHLASVAKNFFHEAPELWRIRTLRWTIISTTAMAFTAGGYNQFMIQFLQETKDMTKAQATSVLVVASFGALAGIITGGRLADRLRKTTPTGRLWVIVIGMASSIPMAAFAILAPKGLPIYIAGTLTLFTFSLYHAPMAATVDDLAPPGKRVAAQGFVIGVMHLLGTAPSSWIMGKISVASNLTTAMWIPLGTLAIGAFAMANATRSFVADHERARGAAAAL